MTESIDRTAIKAEARTWANLHRANTYQREGVKHVDTLLDALVEAEVERDEFKRLFSECHPVHLDGVKRAHAAEARAESAERDMHSRELHHFESEVKLEEAEAKLAAVEKALIPPNRLDEYGVKPLRWSMRKAYAALHPEKQESSAS